MQPRACRRGREGRRRRDNGGQQATEQGDGENGDGRSVDGQGTSRAKAIANKGAADVDYELSSGRMPLPPLAKKGVRIRRHAPRYSPPEIAALVTYVSGLGGNTGVPIPTVGVLALTPTMFGPFLQWASALALEGILPKRDQEILALRTAWHCHSKFEWVEHADLTIASRPPQKLIDLTVRRISRA